jgi:hypothetical protein
VNWKITIIAGLILISGDLYADKPVGKTVPFHGAFSGYLLGFNENVDAINARCDPPSGQVAWAIASFHTWGTATHMGETYMYAEHCSYRPVDGPPMGFYGEGEFQLTADNGDILMGAYTNGVPIAPPPIIGFMEFSTFHDGGTGRFTFASGNGVDIGSFNTVDGSITMQMTGVIAYGKRQK